MSNTGYYNVYRMTTKKGMVRYRAVIEALLDGVAHIGKHRKVGYGEVLEWRVESVTFDSVFTDDALLARPVPVQAMPALGLYCEDGMRLMGWTPPAWKPDLWRECYPTGAKVLKVL